MLVRVQPYPSKREGVRVRFNEPVLKTGGGQPSLGSNPSLSAKNIVDVTNIDGAKYYGIILRSPR